MHSKLAYMSDTLGINIIGYIKGEFGIGEAARLNIKAAQEVGLPVSLVNYEAITVHRNEDTTFTNFSKEFPYPINLIQISPSEVGNFMLDEIASGLKGKYNILYVAWESEYIPEEYIKNISHFDEIWVPSKFCQETLSRISKVPVINIPHPVEIHLQPTTDVDALHFYETSQFNFLFIFDYNSTLERKNTLNLIKAFQKAFDKDNQQVALTIKTSSAKKFATEKEELIAAIGAYQNIKIVEKIFDKNSLNHIMNGCDCYVSLHRSEGFGLTMAEAMCLNKPVIATGYSGNMEFMDFQNSFLVNYEKTTAGENRINYDKNTIWSEPDVDHAASLMKYVFENKAAVALIAVKGNVTIRNNFSFKSIGSLIKNRAEFILQNKVSSSGKQVDIEQQIENEKLREELRIIKKSKFIMMIINFKMMLRKRNEQRKKDRFKKQYE